MVVKTECVCVCVCLTQQQTCNEVIIKDPTTPNTHRYRLMCGFTVKVKEKECKDQRTVGTGTSQCGQQERQTEIVRTH